MSISALFNTKHYNIDTTNGTAVAAMVEDMFLTVYGITANNIPAGFVDWWVEQIVSGKIAAENMVSTSLGFVEAGQFAAAEQANASNIVAASNAAQAAANATGATLQSTTTAATQVWADAVKNMPVAGTFTLTDVTGLMYDMETIDVTPIVTKAVYWGGADKASVEDDFYNFIHNGVPLAELIKVIEMYAGLNFVQLGLINVTNDLENDTAQFSDYAAVSDIRVQINNEMDSSAIDGDVWVDIWIDNMDGSQSWAEASIAFEHYNLIRTLLIDDNGDSRLYEVITTTFPQVAVIDANGNNVRDVNGNVITRDLAEYEVRIGDGSVVKTGEPIVLTPNHNNGGTIETGLTSNGNDLIVAGRLELLHQAYIDGGAGYNVLEVDAKGYFAQPLALINIDEVRIQNLPNIYTTEVEGSTSWFNLFENSSYPELALDGYNFQNSTLDLSRATSLVKVVVTEGDYHSLAEYPGTLTVTGIRNGAEVTLDGGFSQDVKLNFSGNQGNGVNLVFNNLSMGDGEGEPQLIVAHNSNTLNIESTGGNNYLANADLGGMLNVINISGDAYLFIDDDLGRSLHEDTLATINASQNTGGVNLFIDDITRIEFIGSQGDDTIRIEDAEEVSIVNAAGANRYNIEMYPDDDSTVDRGNLTILDGTGGNIYDIEAHYGTDIVISAQGGNNIFDMQDCSCNDSTLSIHFTGGSNIIDLGVDVPQIVITLDEGQNQVMVHGTENISVTAAGAGNTIQINGTYELDAGVHFHNGALVNIEFTGQGGNVVVLGGHDGDGVTALEGSSITGQNVTLRVEEPSDLRAADLNGIERVIIDHDISDRIDQYNKSNYTPEPALTLTASQFMEIGPEAFAVVGSIFNTYAQVKIIVDQNMDLTTLGVESLPRNIDLQLEVDNAVTLTLTAQQLHEWVAPNGITLSNQGTDLVSGKVVIENGGLNFDPFNMSDSIKTTIPGREYLGGSVSNDFMVDGKLFNVDVKSMVVGGYDRPADQESRVVITLDTEQLSDGTMGAFSTWHSNLQIVGNSDVTFTGPISLGLIQGVATNDFIIDFSELNGNVTNLTLNNFETVGVIVGNFSDTRINVVLGDSGDSGPIVAGPLVTSGVEQYFVVDIQDDDNVAVIELCNNTRDVEVLGLKGNANKAVAFTEVPWNVVNPVFVLEGDGAVNWNDVQSKAAGTPDQSNVGTLVASFFAPGAPAVFQINNGGVELGVTSTGAPRPLVVDGIVVENAYSAQINVTDGNAVISSLVSSDDTLQVLTVNASDSVIINGDLPSSLTSVDASDVVGALSVTLTDVAEDLVFVGAQGATSITFSEDVTAGTIASITGEGEITLTLNEDVTVDLSKTTLENVTSVVLGQDASLTLTMEQADDIGAGNFAFASGANSATLSLSGLDGEEFAIANFADGISVSIVSLANDPVITLHENTDLTGIDALVVPKGTVLNLTAAQFQQLGDGTITGVDNTLDFTVNITDLTQADVEDGIDLSGVTAENFTITMAEDIQLANTDALLPAEVIIGDDMTLTLADIQQADGLVIGGGENTTLKFTDTTAGITESIDASGFNVDYLMVLNLLVAERNIDLMFAGLPGSVEKVIYNGEGWAKQIDQTVTVLAGTTVEGWLVLNPNAADTEIANFTVNLEGGTDITGNLRLSTTPKVDGEGNDLMRLLLQTVTINSTGDEGNLFTGSTTNIIGGDITPMGVAWVGSTDNNLLDLTINADQNLVIKGSIIFNSVTGDDKFLANDNDEAVATLTVNGTADVDAGTLDTSDADVVALNVINNGTGTLSATLNAANIDADDALSFTGTGAIELTVVGAVDLSDDDLTAVTQITIADGAVLTLSQAQIDALGAAAIIDGDDEGDATLHIIDFDSSVPFDATAIDENIAVSITMMAGNQVMNPIANLTGVEEINVPANGVLTLTAEQFMQLESGTINAVNATVNITGLTQAMVDDGFSLENVTSSNINVSLAESINIASENVITDNSGTVLGADPGNVEFQLGDNQTLGLGDILQFSPRTGIDGTEVPAGLAVAGSGLTITGGTGTAVEFQFSNGIGPFDTFDASGVSVDSLRLLNDLVDNRNVELLQYIHSDVTVVIYQTLLDMPGYLASVNRVVVIEEGVTIPGFIVFNDASDDSEVRTLTITMEGDATIDGTLYLTTRDKDPELLPRNFDTLTINSLGDDANTIDGNITAISVLPWTNDNNLLNVVIDAQQQFDLTGSLIFNGLAVADNTASLTISGPAAVNMKALDTSDAEVQTLNVVNNGGTLTLTGGSPGGNLVDTAHLNLSGNGDIIFGVDSNPGINGGGELTTINASGLTGDLTINTLNGINGQGFTFTSGTGETSVTLNDVELVSTGVWSFNFANATGTSEFVLNGEPDFSNAGSLMIALGDNTTLRITDNTDFTALLALNITGSGEIVLENGAELTLTAAQASAITAAGLTVVGNGTVNITELNNGPVYDFSAFSADVAGTITLAVDDVKVAAGSILADFSITLEAVGNDFGDGQTIRFTDAVQAEREILITGANSDGTNVIWDFDAITGTAVAGQIDTRDYSHDLGRLWIYDGLADGTNVENLYTVLHSNVIVRLANRDEFAAIQADPSGTAISRTVEIESFTELAAGLSFTALDVTDPSDPVLQFIANLTVTMGGEVELGDLTLDNIIGAPTSNSPDFNTLTINSRSANSDTHYLLPEGFQSGAQLPNRINDIGDISSGNNRDQLFNVVIDTGVQWTFDVSNQDGAAVNINSIAFSADGLDESSTLTVNGFYTTTVGTLDFTDASLTETDAGTGDTFINVTLDGDGALDVTGAMEFDSAEPNTTVNLTVEGDVSVDGKTLALSANIDAINVTNNSIGTVNITGGSPAVSGDSLETMTVTGSGDVVIGSESDDSDAIWGVVAPQLSSLTAEAGLFGDITIYLDEINGEDFTYAGTAGLGEGSHVNLWLDEVGLNGTGSWEFNLVTANVSNSSNLNLTGDSDFSNGGELTINFGTGSGNTNLYCWGDNNLSAVDLTLTGVGDIVIAPTAVLTLSAQQLDAINQDASISIDKKTEGDDNGRLVVEGEGDLRELDLTDADALVMTGYTVLTQAQLEAFEGSIDKNAHILDVELQQAAVDAWPTGPTEQELADLLEALEPVDNFVVNGIVDLRGVDDEVFEAIFAGGRTLSIDAGGAVLMTDAQEAYFEAEGGVIQDEGTDLLVDAAFLTALTDGDLREIRGLESIQIVVESADAEIAVANDALVFTAAQALDIPAYAVTVDAEGVVTRALVDATTGLVDLVDGVAVADGDFRSVVALADVTGITVHVADNRDLTSLQGLTAIVLDESAVEITVTVDQAALVTGADTDTVTIITELDGSNANLSALAGTVRLDTEGNDIAFVGQLAADTTYEVIGGGSLDLTGATIGANASFDLIQATDLIMTAAQLNAVITGTGDITDTGNNSTVTAANLEGSPALSLENVNVNRFVATVDVTGGVTLTGALANAELVVTGSNDNGTDTLNVSGTDRDGFGTISSIDFGGFEFTVNMTGNTYRGISESFGGENATVLYTTESGVVTVWGGDTLGTLRFENGNNIIHTMNGLTDTINAFELNDNNLQVLTLNFVQGEGVLQEMRIFNANNLDTLNLKGDTTLDSTVILDGGATVQLGSTGNSTVLDVDGNNFTLRGEGAGAHVATIGANGNVINATGVSESMTLAAGAGGLTLQKTDGTSVRAILVNSLDELNLDASLGNLTITGTGGTFRTSDVIQTVNITLGAGNFSTTNTNNAFELGTFTSAGAMNVSGAGTATIDVLELTLNGADYTMSVGTGSTLNLTDAFGIDLGNNNALILTGAGTVSLAVGGGATPALWLANTALSESTLDASGFTGTVGADIHAHGSNGTVMLGAGDETYSLTRGTDGTDVGTFTFEVNGTANGTVGITGFAHGATDQDILDFSTFAWSTAATAAQFSTALDGLTTDSNATFSLDADGIDSTGAEFLVFTEVGGGNVTITGDGITGTITLVGVAENLDAANFDGIGFAI